MYNYDYNRHILIKRISLIPSPSLQKWLFPNTQTSFYPGQQISLTMADAIAPIPGQCKCSCISGIGIALFGPADEGRGPLKPSWNVGAPSTRMRLSISSGGSSGVSDKARTSAEASPQETHSIWRNPPKGRLPRDLHASLANLWLRRKSLMWFLNRRKAAVFNGRSGIEWEVAWKPQGVQLGWEPMRITIAQARVRSREKL
jgi:hypothetical protein